MANPQRKVKDNVPGEFFVDTTCIDCDTCRQLAPEVFGESGEYSYVRRQPETEREIIHATRALLCCPTGSIGTEHANRAKEVLADFPLPLEDEVYYCGFNSPKSFGGNSYFIRHPKGNWLVDSPKFLPHLVRQLENMGGVSRIFLSHRDDVADAADYARHFDAKRVIHRDELSAQPDAEIVIDGIEPVPMNPGFLVIPTPGHTKGHCVLLHKDKFLFTGDHLWWDREDKRLGASSTYCWYSWNEQKRSLARLRDFTFQWVLPGHGDRVKLTPSEMAEEMDTLLKRIGA